MPARFPREETPDSILKHQILSWLQDSCTYIALEKSQKVSQTRKPAITHAAFYP